VVARHLGVEISGEWRVLGLFVTRQHSPAACDSRAPFRFVLLRDLNKMIRLSHVDSPNGPEASNKGLTGATGNVGEPTE
jgi:hypothetical protein